MTNDKLTTNIIDAPQLKKYYDTDKNLLLIDVREQHEWQAQHIPAAINIPLHALVTNIKNLAKTLDSPIYLHCKAGTRSLNAVILLQNLGYTNVYSLSGGIISWAAHSFPVE